MKKIWCLEKKNIVGAHCGFRLPTLRDGWGCETMKRARLVRAEGKWKKEEGKGLCGKIRDGKKTESRALREFSVACTLFLTNWRGEDGKRERDAKNAPPLTHTSEIRIKGSSKCAAVCYIVLSRSLFLTNLPLFCHMMKERQGDNPYYFSHLSILLFASHGKSFHARWPVQGSHETSIHIRWQSIPSIGHAGILKRSD